MRQHREVAFGCKEEVRGARIRAGSDVAQSGRRGCGDGRALVGVWNQGQNLICPGPDATTHSQKERPIGTAAHQSGH